MSRHRRYSLLSVHLATLALAGSALSAQVLAPNLVYTSIQPCRLFDTRVAGGALVANTVRHLNAVGVSAPGSLASQGGNSNGCPIPGFDSVPEAQVQAIVINLAVITPAGTGVLQAWPTDQSKPNASVLNFTSAEVVLANSVVLPVRQDSQGNDIILESNVGTQALGDVVGYYTVGSPVQGAGIDNLFLGKSAGNPGTATGTSNTAVGAGALSHNTTGSSNTAFGSQAMTSNTNGTTNTAVGLQALSMLAAGGSNNIALGFNAGGQYTTSESSNISIGNVGSTGESNTIRIGTDGSGAGQQSATFIAGIAGASATGGSAVYITSSGQLGTITALSSLRFKEDVTDMGAASDGLMSLRPVTFHYKAQYDDGSKLLQYGLIAEEVAKIYPGLVQYDKDGQPQTVRYSMVNAMVLNELQKQHTTNATQATELEQQRDQIAAQARQLDLQRDQIAAQGAVLRAQQARLDELAAQMAALKATAAQPR
jgi:Chaperone of endosialidase